MFRALLPFFLLVGNCIFPAVSPQQNDVEIAYCTNDNCNDYYKKHSARPFQLECTGEDACKDIKVTCPDDYYCVVNCVGKASCSGNFKFYGSKRAHSLLSCDGEDACKAAQFKCKSDHFLCAVVDIGPHSVIDLEFRECDQVKDGDASVYKIQYCGSGDRTAQTYGSDSLLKDYVCSDCNKCFRPPGNDPDNSCHSHEDNPQKCISPGQTHFEAEGYHVWCGGAAPTTQAQTITSTTTLAPTTTTSATTLAPTTTTFTPTMVPTTTTESDVINVVLDSTTDGKTYTGGVFNFYDAGGSGSPLAITNSNSGRSSSDGTITFDAGAERTWDLTLNDFDFPHSSGDFNHFGQLSLTQSLDGSAWNVVSVSWFTDTGGKRSVSDRVSGASGTGEWPTPGNVVPAYELVASVSYGAPSDRKVAINSRWVRFTYKNSVKDENHANGGKGWDITLKAVGSGTTTTRPPATTTTRPPATTTTRPPATTTTRPPATTTTQPPATTTTQPLTTPDCTWRIQFPESHDEPKSVFETGGSTVYVSAFVTLLPPVYTCSRTLQFRCSSTNTNEVRVGKVFEIEERTPGPKSIARAGSTKIYNISLFGVKDYVNGDGANNVTINCSTNFNSFSTFSVKSVDVFLPNFDFSKRDGETLTLLYAGNKFTIVAPETLTGPTFLSHGEQLVYLGSYRLPNSSISIDEDGRRLMFDVPTQGLCTKLECDISVRVENQRPGRRKERLLRRELGDFEDEDSRTKPSDPKPISFTKRAHYVKSPCHEDPVCEIPVANHHNYPSSRCPVGHTGSCKPCPVGARCPGGNLVWALPGFSTAIVEQSDGSMAEAIVPCPVPKERCLGYNKEQAADTCAVGYGGPTCGGCTDGFFSKPVGPPTCFPCPKDVTTSSSIVAAILYLLVILFGVFMVITIMSYIILKRNGGTFAGGMQRSKEFIIYTCISIALLSQASRVTLGKLPYYLNDLAYALAIFQMDVSGPVSPDCINTEMFWRETLLFYISLFSICFFCITINKRLRLKYCRGCRQSLNRARHGVAFLLCFMYPLVTTFVIKMQNCIPAIDGSKTVLYVLSGNTLVKCYTGNHALPYLLSSVVGIFHVVAFPFASTIVIIYVRRKYVTSWSSTEDNIFDGRPLWKFFLQNSYLPQKFWIRQLDLVIFFVCTVCNEIFARRNIHVYLGVYAVLLALSIVIYGTNKPFIKQESWKLPVRMYMFFCIFTYALTNYVSSDLIVDHEREDVQALFQLMCTVTMVFCLLLFLLLIVCYVKTLVDGAKAEEKEEVRKRSIVEMTKATEEGVRGHSVIEFFSNPINFVKTTVDAAKAEEEGRKPSIVEMTQANANAPPSPSAAPALEKKKAAKNEKKKRRTRQPPPNTKVFGTWWELISEDGKPYYYNQKENRTQWERPQGWVKFMATERFNGVNGAVI